MLVAFDDHGLRVEEIPAQEIMMFQHPIADHEEARRILDEAKKQHPEVQWVIVGSGPWGVRGEL